MSRKTLLILAAAAAAALSGMTRAQDHIWDGTTNIWGDQAHWTPTGVPDTTGENAFITGGTVTLDASYGIGTLNLTGGAIDGTFNLTANTLNWTYGNMSDNGSTTVTGDATVNANNGYLSLYGRTLNLQGNTTQSGINGYGPYLQNAATLNNSGSYAISDDSDINT
ncbi:MAG: hypothetical protein IT446_07705, partial [Phycisphaerales bacterium]|nr:hypothetical protein [Phycisphaerales bacterium]